ncbi:tyrosine-type recombinase/integrase [Limnoglobus roseus]
MNALRLQVGRLRKKLNLPADVCPYLIRHGFGTKAILNGVNGPTLAELMGHSSRDMIQKVYVHLADQHEHLAAAVEKINGSAKPSPAASSPTRKIAAQVPKKSRS